MKQQSSTSSNNPIPRGLFFMPNLVMSQTLLILETALKMDDT